jgi:hypothetical protein
MKYNLKIYNINILLNYKGTKNSKEYKQREVSIIIKGNGG